MAWEAARWAEAGFFREAEALAEREKTWLVDSRARLALTETLFTQDHVGEALAAADRIPDEGWRAQALARIAFTLRRRGEESWAGVALSCLRATLEQFPQENGFAPGLVFADLDDGSPASWDAWLRLIELTRDVLPTKASGAAGDAYVFASLGIIPGQADDLLPLALETARPPAGALIGALHTMGHGVDGARIHFLSEQREQLVEVFGYDEDQLAREDAEALAAAGAELRRAGRPVPDFLLDAMASLPACCAD